MKQTYFYLLLGMFSSGGLSAQESVAATGGSGSGTGGSNTYSVGQVVYTEISGKGGTAIQGVQQPYEIFVLGNDDHKNILLTMSAYPNPTISSLTLRVEFVAMADLRYELFDLHGKILHSGSVRAVETLIPMERYPTATYILRVYSGKFELKTFKILKNNL